MRKGFINSELMTKPRKYTKLFIEGGMMLDYNRVQAPSKRITLLFPFVTSYSRLFVINARIPRPAT